MQIFVSIRNIFRLAFLFYAFSLYAFSGCNTFSFMDQPSGDEQILSAARACFDQGDFTCASNFYSQLSDSSSTDTVISESSFLLLTENGASSSVFMTAVLSGATTSGGLLTKLAEAFSSSGNTNEASRLSFLHAYQNTSKISNTQLKGLLEFITAIALASEILGESAGTVGKLKKSDLVSDPSSCAQASIITPTGCNAPGTILLTGSTPIDSLIGATDEQYSGSANLYMLNAALLALESAITHMQAIGNLGTSTASLSQAISTYGQVILQAGTDSPSYRYLLIQNKIGE